MLNRKSFVVSAAAVAIALAYGPAGAAGKYGPGASDTEIKIGNTNPYSGPASAYGTIGKSIAAYWKMVNAEGGINGRKINFVSMDDGYSPPKTVEQIRKLVEQEKVLLIFQSLGTPTNSAIHKYMNAKKVPHLFVATGAGKWGQPKKFPWTMGWQPAYPGEAKIYATYLLNNKPNAKVAILYQNDDYGKDYLNGFLEGLGSKAKTMVVAKEPYETADPTIEPQIIKLKASGADTFFNITTPKFAAQAIKKGDVLSVAEVAGTMAAKRTGELIPLCHPLPVDLIEVRAALAPALPGVHVTTRVRCEGRTGVEMEALTAAAVACLTVYDMVKAVDRGMTIEGVQVLDKTGGTHGDWKRT